MATCSDQVTNQQRLYSRRKTISTRLMISWKCVDSICMCEQHALHSLIPALAPRKGRIRAASKCAGTRASGPSGQFALDVGSGMMNSGELMAKCIFMLYALMCLQFFDYNLCKL